MCRISMLKKRVALQPAYILHRRPYRDTSLLLELFTVDFGRIALVAKGVRGACSRRLPLLQPLQRLLVSWTGSGTLGTLVGVEAAAAPFIISGRLAISALYLNELLLRLLHHDDGHARLFGKYEQALAALSLLEDDCRPSSSAAHTADVATVARTEQTILRLFEKTLLEEIGYGLRLEHDAQTGEPLCEKQRYRYVLDHGPIVAVNESSFSCYGQTLLTFARGEVVSDDDLKALKQLMRRVIDHHLGGKPLQSRRLRLAMERGVL